MKCIQLKHEVETSNERRGKSADQITYEMNCRVFGILFAFPKYHRANIETKQTLNAEIIFFKI